MKSEHDFAMTLVGISELSDAAEDALFEAGCDDATIGVCDDEVFLVFTRSAESLAEAVTSAVRDVLRAGIPGVESIEIRDG